MRHAWLVCSALLAITVACTDAPAPVAADPPDDDGLPAAAPEDTTAPTATDDLGLAQPPPEEPQPCRFDGLEDEAIISLTSGGLAELSLEVAGRTHRCAPVTVVAPADAPWAASLAAPLASVLEAPLLLLDADDPAPLLDRLEELETADVLAVGSVAGLRPRFPGTITPVDDPAATPMQRALAIAEHAGVTRFLAFPQEDLVARAGALSRLDGETALLPITDEPAAAANLAARLRPTVRLEVVAADLDVAAELSDTLLAVGIDAVAAARPVFLGGSTTAWLVDPGQPQATAIAALAATGRADALLPIDPTDLRRGGSLARRVRDLQPRRTVLTGAMTPDAAWQLPLILDGPELPGGGFLLFEDRRVVALYGSPVYPTLGALGEQPLDETVPRLREVAEPYGTDSRQVLPAFEMMATVASGEAEDTEDFSRRTDIEVLRPWIDRARDEDLYVVLDLQPGRTDFLTQAQEYEELLVEPHVGLALDAEWRLTEEQVHLDQIGSVPAAEVQQVIDWLAALTREHQLPQKLLVLHQFQDGMLPDRDTLEAPPELAVVVHMDGQGSLPAKDETYAAITEGAEDRWWWGWKNFYDEDEPVATPEQVLSREPRPVFVSYQ